VSLLTVTTVHFAGSDLERTSAPGEVIARSVWNDVAPSVLRGNGWQNLGSSRSTVGYFRDESGVVHLKGAVAPAFERIPRSSTVFRLPEGDRPGRAVVLPVLADGGLARLTIRPDGAVVAVVERRATKSLSLDGVAFPTARVSSFRSWRVVSPAELQRNGWANIGRSRSPASYYRDESGVVHLAGGLRAYFGRIPDRSTVFVLPEGFRPEADAEFAALLDDGIARVGVAATGSVVVAFAGGSAESLSLDGISFRAGA
jgi:hypothetical protein